MTLSANDAINETAGRRVSRRHILHIHGFEARSARFYRRDYARGARTYQERFGDELTVSAMTRYDDEAAIWDVDAVMDGMKVHTTFEVLRWDNLVRERLDVPWWRSVFNSFWCAWTYVGYGLPWRYFRMHVPAGWFSIYPFVLVFLQVVLTVLAGYGGYALLADNTHPIIASLAGLAAAGAMIELTKRYLIAQKTYYLVENYAVISREARQNEPAIAAARQRFAARMVACMNDSSLDEVLIVGHSHGTIEAVAALALALDKCNAARSPNAPQVSFLTIGETIGLIAWQPVANWYREALLRVCASPLLSWIDFTAPQDSLSFALTDPALPIVCDVRFVRQAGPKPLSAKWAEIHDKENLAALRFDFYNMHYLYMRANDAPGDFDWFAITAGSLTLPARFAHRRSSIASAETDGQQQ